MPEALAYHFWVDILDDVEARWTNERLAEDQVAPQDWWEAVA